MTQRSTAVLERAYSLLTIKSFNDDERILEGIATTPTPDRYADIVEPDGASFELPLPFLWQHDASKPIGHVTKAKILKAGIEVLIKLVKPAEGAPQPWADRLNSAWADLKSGLVRGLSIGFSPIEYTFIEDTYGYRFVKWDWLELSGVTIPANSEAMVTSIKSIRQIDRQLRAASGLTRKSGVRLLTPGVSGKHAHARRGAIQLITSEK